MNNNKAANSMLMHLLSRYKETCPKKGQPLK